MKLWYIALLLAISPVLAVPLGGEIYYNFEGQTNNQWYSFANGAASNLTYSTGSPFTTAGNFGSTVAFNVSHPVISSQGSNFTIMFYFKANGTITDQILFSNKLQGSDAARFAININSTGHIVPGYVRQDTGTSHNILNQSLKVTVPSSTWHSFAFAMNDTQTRVYLDGLVVYQNTTLSRVETITSNPTAFIGGRAYGDYGNRFNGSIDEFKTFNRSLSGQEILNEQLANVSIVSVLDTYDNSQVSGFTVNWSNSTATLQNNSNGAAAYYNGITGYYNITTNKTGFYTNNTLNWNVSQSLNLRMSQGTVNISMNTPGFTASIYNTTDGSLLLSNFTSDNSILLHLATTSFSSGNITVFVNKTNYTNFNTTAIMNFNDTWITGLILINPSILNITVYDEQTLNVINNVTLKLITSNASTNYSTTNGRFYLENLTSQEYEIIYDAEGYYLRRYYTTLTPASYAVLPLYLLNETPSTNVLATFTLKDSDGVRLPSTLLKALRYFPEYNQYRIVEVAKSDQNGEGGMHLQQVEPRYIYIIEQDGVTLLITSGGQLFGTSISLTGNTADDVVRSSVDLNSAGTITFNNNTYTFTLLFNSPSGIIRTICMNVTKHVGSATANINSSCLSNTQTGSISLGIGMNVTGDYIAQAYASTSTQFSDHVIATGGWSSSGAYHTWGILGLFLAFCIVATLGLAGAFFIESAGGTIILGLFGIIISWVLGLIDMSFYGFMFILAVGVMLITFSRLKQ